MMLKRLTVGHQSIFNALLVYYWLLLYFERQEEEVVKFSGLYFALVLPLLLYIVWNSWHILFGKYEKRTLLLLAFLFGVGLVSVFRSDYATLYNAAILMLPLIIAMNAEAKVSIGLLNALFVCSILGSVITHFTGNNVYGFLPGQAASSATQGLQWRVSLFPALPESAFFSLIVLLANFSYNLKSSKYVFGGICLYFIFLSAVRTSLLALLLVSLFLLTASVVRFKGNTFYQIFFIVAAGLFIMLVNIDLIVVTLDINNAFLNHYFFRSEGQSVGGEELAKTIYRSWLWGQHLRIFWQHPWIGIGTFKLKDIVDAPLFQGDTGTGSESFLTGWMARIGLLILPLVIFFQRHYSDAIARGDKFLYCFCLAWFVFSMGYGSFMVPYHFLFLLSLGILNMHRKSEGTVSQSAAACAQ